MSTKHIELEPGLLEKVVGILGKQITKVQSPVSFEMYNEMINEMETEMIMDIEEIDKLDFDDAPLTLINDRCRFMLDEFDEFDDFTDDNDFY